MFIFIVVFQINSISLIDSEEFRETSIELIGRASNEKGQFWT